MHMFEDLKEMLEAEIKNIVKQDSMTPQNLEGAGKAIDILKDIETIEAMRGSHQYSNNSYNSYRVKESLVGGGGSSDFGIAKVTFINTNENGSPYIVNGVPFFDGEDMIFEGVSVGANPVTVSVAAYKNGFPYNLFIESIDYDFPPVTTGGVSMEFETGLLIVSGDGTFTAKGMKMV